MRVEDIYVWGRTWVRLHEKGGNRHEMPRHHNLKADLRNCIEAIEALQFAAKIHGVSLDPGGRNKTEKYCRQCCWHVERNCHKTFGT